MTRLGMIGFALMGLVVAFLFNLLFVVTWANLFLPKGAHEGNTESIVFTLGYIGPVVFWPIGCFLLWWLRRNGLKIVSWFKEEIK